MHSEALSTGCIDSIGTSKALYSQAAPIGSRFSDCASHSIIERISDDCYGAMLYVCSIKKTVVPSYDSPKLLNSSVQDNKI